MTTVMYGGAPPPHFDPRDVQPWVFEPLQPLPRDVDPTTTDRLALHESLLTQKPLGIRVITIDVVVTDDDIRKAVGAPPHATVERCDGNTVVSWGETGPVTP